MKKYIGPVLLSIVIGVYLGRFMIGQYKELDVSMVDGRFENVFFLQRGVYSSFEIMKENMLDFSYYIYNVEDDGYHAYVGITKDKLNADRIKEYFYNMGYDIYVKEIGLSNDAFLTVLDQYDLLLSESADDVIDDICNQVLSSYEELVLNEN